MIPPDYVIGEHYLYLIAGALVILPAAIVGTLIMSRLEKTRDERRRKAYERQESERFVGKDKITLLRPSSPSADAETLLRAANAAAGTQPDMLLRPAHTEYTRPAAEEENRVTAHTGT